MILFSLVKSQNHIIIIITQPFYLAWQVDIGYYWSDKQYNVIFFIISQVSKQRTRVNNFRLTCNFFSIIISLKRNSTRYYLSKPTQSQYVPITYYIILLSLALRLPAQMTQLQFYLTPLPFLFQFMLSISFLNKSCCIWKLTNKRKRRSHV